MGIDWETATEQSRHECEQLERRIVMEIKQEVLEFLTNNKPLVKALAKELVKSREISGDEFAQWLAKHGQIPTPPQEHQPLVFATSLEARRASLKEKDVPDTAAPSRPSL